MDMKAYKSDQTVSAEHSSRYYYDFCRKHVYCTDTLRSEKHRIIQYLASCLHFQFSCSVYSMKNIEHGNNYFFWNLAIGALSLINFQNMQNLLPMSVFNLTCSDSCYGDQKIKLPALVPSPTSDGAQILKQDLNVTKDPEQMKNEMDYLISQALNELSSEERQQQLEILHGIVDKIAEQESVLCQALWDLDHYLELIKQGSIYEIAEGMDPVYVRARPFRVMFLRANDYDAKAAADHLLRFFESKHELFGPEKLTKDITLFDFDKDDIACLKTGCIQLGGRDRSGRQVFVHFAGLMENLKAWLRVQYFVKMRALMASEETQVRGTVSIWYAIGNFRNEWNGQEYLQSYKAARALPQKKAATHICVDDIQQQSLLCNVMVKAMKGDMRVRLRVHCGTQMECQFQMSTYGILPQSLPLDPNGRMELERHLNWIEHCATDCKYRRAASPSKAVGSPTVSSPNPDDVLFTGGKIRDHAGTQRFQGLVRDHSQIYDCGTGDMKRRIADTLIHKIHGNGGRFLKQSGHSNQDWEEVPLDQVRKKVMQTFRNRRRLDNPSSRQKTKKCACSGTLIPDKPLPTDVIFGRAQRNPGTELLQRLIRDNSEEYESLDRGVKMRFVETIMFKFTSQGRRFLQQADGMDAWLELSHEDARERISKYFRNYRRLVQQKKTVR